MEDGPTCQVRFSEATEVKYDIGAAEIQGNSQAVAIIDCTGGLVSDVYLSRASDMAIRADRGSSKKPKKLSACKTMALFDVLNFHLVFSLATGPFVACEAVLVERTATTFQDILEGYRKRLLIYGSEFAHIRYVSDMSIPFAYAVMHVFNRMSLPEYMSVLCFSAKIGKDIVAERHIRTRLVWCGVHRDRALSKYGREAFKKRSSKTQREMMIFFGNVRVALTSAKSYEDLCILIGFLDAFVSMESFKFSPPHMKVW